jgi:hypothetical protein
MKEKNLTAMECVPDKGVEQPKPILIEAMFEGLYRRHKEQVSISLEGKRLTIEDVLRGAEYVRRRNEEIADYYNKAKNNR